MKYELFNCFRSLEELTYRSFGLEGKKEKENRKPKARRIETGSRSDHAIKIRAVPIKVINVIGLSRLSLVWGNKLAVGQLKLAE